MGHLRSFMFGGSTVQCFIWLNSNHVCGTNITVAAVTKVHCLYNVRCCLAVDPESLQRCFSWMDLRTLIKFHVLLGKSALAYYKSKESLGPHAPSYETVHNWVNAIKNCQEETDDAPLIGGPTSATDECNMEQVKSVLEHMHSIICTAIATEVRISPAYVYHILTNSLGKQKVYAKWIPQALYDDQRTTCVLLATTHLQHGEMKAVY